MIDIRIVCTLDAKPAAESLMRLLTAEGHVVRLCYGRGSLAHIGEAAAAREAIILIWSANAPFSQYMDEWARAAPAARLIEIALTAAHPQINRRAAVLDFSAWRGERGGRAWHTLNERLRAVARALEPAKPPPVRAALALGMLSAAAVTGAVIVRINDVADLQSPERVENVEQDMLAMDYQRDAGVGGAVRAIEPASIGDEGPISAPRYRAPPALPPLAQSRWAQTSAYEAPELRDATLLEMIVALNPAARSEEP
ncbi:MAG: hypothetical protein JNK94_03640 [Hyphomonadaceae bacterium]|nr:hypothetical protein [Hyphomonadaceae bacterium]